MGKYIKLHYYFYNYRCSKKELCSILIYTDSIKLVSSYSHYGTGSIVTMNNGEMINVVETIEEIKNLLATEDKSLILIATKVGAYLHGTVCFSTQKEYKIGYYSEEWFAFNFTISSDKVVLSNI